MNFLKIAMFGVVLGLLGLGFSDTAQGQTITTVPTVAAGMSFTVQSGGSSSSQQLSVTTNLGGSTTLIVGLSNTPGWLTVNNKGTAVQSFTINTPSDGTPAIFTITANTAGLSTTQTMYNGTFTIQVANAPNSLITYPVTLNLGGPTQLSSNPQTLGFSATQGATAGNPSFIPVIVSSSGAQLNYTISAATQSGGTWIQLSTTSSTTNNSTAGFQVAVNPSGLPVGTYNGTVTLQSQSTNDSLVIQVTLQVSQGQTINVTGTLNTFTYQYGSGQAGFTVQTQQLAISTTSGTIPYTVTATSPQTTNWLVLPQASTVSTTPQTISFYLSEQYVVNLTPGTYTITVSIAAGGQTVPVVATLVVSSSPILTVNPKTLSFTIPFNTASIPSQTVTVSSSNSSTAIPYQVQVTSNTPWLTVSPASGTTVTNQVFSVFVNPASLSVSNTPFQATVVVSPTNADAGLYSITIPVSVTITAATSSVYAGPDQLLFSYEQNQSNQLLPQIVNLTSAAATAFSVSTSTVAANNCPSTNWLTATPTNGNITNATLSVSVNQNGMSAGSCMGTVSVTYNNGSNATATLTIPVTVDISASTPLLTVTTPPGFGVVTATYQTTGTVTQQISINSTDGSPIQFTASASTGAAPSAWLFLGANSGTTQQYLTVQIAPSSLPVGVYTGSITISPVSATNLPSGPLVIPVTLTVTTNATINVSPTALSFTMAQGATPPAAQQVTLTSTTSNTTFTASVPSAAFQNWLQVSPTSGTFNGTTATLTASVAANTLSPGTYSSAISIFFPNTQTSATVNVTLKVTASQTVTVAPTSLNFSYQLGGSAPAAQTLNVTSTGGAVSVQVGSSSTGTNAGWLSVTPTSGSTGASGTPLALTVAVSPTGFNTAGTYNGTITITPAGGAAITVNVTLTVTGVPPPQPVTISNSANGAFGSIAPGELITIKGANIGPTTPLTFSVGAGNTVANILGGVQVTFDGIPGTPTYVSATQVNVVVPYEIAGRTSTSVVLSYQNQQSAGITQSVAAWAPGIYTFSATGAGQAAALNQNGTFNGPAAGLIINGQNVSTSPASAGQIIALYMTGGGQTNPPSVTGTITPTGATLYNVPGSVNASINGVPATVVFAGGAPGLVAGAIQVNVRIPTGVTGNNLSIVVNINGSLSLVGPTIAVQ